MFGASGDGGGVEEWVVVGSQRVSNRRRERTPAWFNIFTLYSFFGSVGDPIIAHWRQFGARE